MTVKFFAAILHLTKPYFLLSSEEKDPEAGLENPPLLMDNQELPNVECVTEKKSRKAKMKHFVSREINVDNVYLLMLVCCVITGFIDGTLYNGM